MNKIEALELELEARKMVDGTELDWWRVIKYRGFTVSQGPYELALGIVEGKPVWKGDLIWCVGYAVPQEANTLWLKPNVLCECSWNSPVPKTVIIELEYDVVLHAAGLRPDISPAITKACRKALEELK